MKERTKMPRQERAKQFAPFDALKGLQTALRIKEFEHEKKSKAELSEEQTDKISKVLFNLEKGDFVAAQFFRDGHVHSVQGEARLDIEKMQLCFSKNKIPLDDLLDLEILQKGDQAPQSADADLEIMQDQEEK